MQLLPCRLRWRHGSTNLLRALVSKRRWRRQRVAMAGTGSATVMPSSLDGMHETCEHGMSNLPRHPGMACKRSVLRPASALADYNQVSEASGAAWAPRTLPGGSGQLSRAGRAQNNLANNKKKARGGRQTQQAATPRRTSQLRDVQHVLRACARHVNAHSYVRF